MSVSPAAPLVKTLRELTLLEPDQLAEVEQSLAGQFPEPRALAKELLRRGWLTSYQITQLSNKKGHELLLGPYVLLDRIGEGGMGQVFKARHRKLGRVVAIKLILKDRLDNPAAVKRFYREVQAASQLDHPNIVRALDADCVGETHLFVMEYVDGQDLAQVLHTNGPLPIADACEYIRQAALGLQHAFERGLVHRDIKPSNLLVVRGGVVSGTTHPSLLTPHQVKLLDMGLARLDRADDSTKSSTLTQEGMVMGTPDYIAPEQARSSHEVDVRADLYSLGCTFYHLLTGQAPFAGGSLTEKLLKHQLDEAAPVEMIRLDTPPHVAQIIRRLMAKRPEHRFQTPAEFVQALSLDPATLSRESPPARIDPTPRDESSIATPPEQGSTTLPLVEQLRRRRAEKQEELLKFGIVAGISAVVVFAGLILFVVKPWSVGAKPKDAEPQPTIPKTTPTKPKTPQELAAEAEKIRQADADAAFKSLAASFSERPTFAKFAQEAAAFKAKHGGTPAAIKAAEMLMTLPSPLDQLAPAEIPEDARAAWKAIRFDGKDVVGVLGEHRWRHWAEVSSLAYSLDGKTLATGTHDGGVKLWDPATGGELRTLKGHTSKVSSVAFSRVGKTLASGSHDSTVKLWDSVTGDELHTLRGHTSNASSVAFSPDGKTLASGSNDHTVKLWDLATGSELRTFRGHTHFVTSVAFSPDGKMLASGSVDHTVKLWDPATGGEFKTLGGHPNHVQAVTFSPDGKALASGSVDRTVKLWNLATGSELHTLRGHTSHVSSLAFSSDGKTLASGSQDRTVKLWDPATGNELRTLKGHTSQVGGVAFSPDNTTLASGDGDGGIRLWDVETGTEVQPRHGPTAVTGLALRADCKQLITTSGEAASAPTVWDLTTCQTLLTATQAGNVNYGPKLSLDERWFAAGGSGGVYVWDTNNWNRPFPLKGPKGATYGAAFSPDSRRVAGAEGAGKVWVWDLTTKEEALYPLEHGRFLYDVVFSPDGRRLASVGDSEVILWDATTRSKLWTGSHKLARNVLFSPDGQRLLTSFVDTPIQAWDVATGKVMPLDFAGPQRGAVRMAYSPDGRRVAACSVVGHVVVMDAATGKRLNEWRLPGEVKDVAFSSDNRHLFTANANGTVYILRIPLPSKALTTEEAKKQQADEAKRLGVPVQIENSIGMKLNLIPAGQFLMGSPENEPGREPNEGPRHEVTITKPFHIGVYEVTQAEYDKVTGKNPSTFNKDNGGGPDHPVETVSCDHAVVFCKKLSELPDEIKAGRVYRLPTEAEWEYACRAGTTTTFFFGDDPKLLDRFAALKGYSRVGTLKPNSWGLYDMLGNVWEWCGDRQRRFTAEPVRDAVGAPDATMPLTIRGGSVHSGADPKWFRSACRYSADGDGSAVWGFRVVCEVRPPGGKDAK